MNKFSIKIGILTFHRSQNYGAVLQAFALKKFLENQGFKVDIIDYWPDEMREFYRLIPNYKYRSFLRKIKGALFFILGIVKELKRRRGFNCFVNIHFNLSPGKRLYSQKQQLEGLSHDIVIYGSDQIWRKHPFTGKFDPVYWGIVPVRAKKIAYGASTSSLSLETNDQIFISKMLENFHAIGVREKGFAHLLSSFSSKPINVVIDPVFLLEKSEWEALASTSKIKLPQNPYLLFYHLNYNPEIIPFVNRLAKQLNLSVIEIRGRVFPLKFGKRYIQTASPVDFLNLIQHSELVVTNSFHGTAFSILFEKEFFVVGLNKASHRIQNLLEELSLEDRIIKHTNFVQLQTINYKNVVKKIFEWKQKSCEFLINNILT